MTQRRPEDLLSAIADLVAQRDFANSKEHKQLLLDCVAALLNNAGYGSQVSVF